MTLAPSPLQTDIKAPLEAYLLEQCKLADPDLATATDFSWSNSAVSMDTYTPQGWILISGASTTDGDSNTQFTRRQLDIFLRFSVKADTDEALQALMHGWMDELVVKPDSILRRVRFGPNYANSSVNVTALMGLQIADVKGIPEFKQDGGGVGRLVITCRLGYEQNLV